MKKKTKKTLEDDLRPEYDFSKLKGLTRGKYYHRYLKGSQYVLIEPEVVNAFPNSAAINQALRLFIEMSKVKLRTQKSA